MTHVVNQKCIKCKYTDCVSVCPVNCFYESELFLVIDKDMCIDCGICINECPIGAIESNNSVFDGLTVDEIDAKDISELNSKSQIDIKKSLIINEIISKTGNNITEKKEPLNTAEEYKDKENKFEEILHLSEIKDIL